MTQRKNIVDRVINWNSQRFKQEFDYALELSMLTEEVSELFEATTDIGRMDAVGDIVFVAIGTMWKLGIPNEVIVEMLYHVDLATMDAKNCVGWHNQLKAWFMENGDIEIQAGYTGFDLAVTTTMIVAIGALRGMGLQEYFYDIVEAICDSNDTKPPKKTPTGQKANIDKGKLFVPPDARLFEIYTKAKQGKVN